MANAEEITFSVAGQEITLRVAPDERDDALSAARQVEEKMRDLATKGAMGTLRQAIMVAFQLAFENQELERWISDQKTRRDELDRRLGVLTKTVGEALDNAKRG